MHKRASNYVTSVRQPGVSFIAPEDCEVAVLTPQKFLPYVDQYRLGPVTDYV